MTTLVSAALGVLCFNASQSDSISIWSIWFYINPYLTSQVLAGVSVVALILAVSPSLRIASVDSSIAILNTGKTITAIDWYASTLGRL